MRRTRTPSQDGDGVRRPLVRLGGPISERRPSAARGIGFERRPSVPPPTRSVRDFAQRRAKETYDALLVATERVFSEKTYDEAQTPDIARAANVSVGTFYRYFADKRQAFIEMISAYLDRVYELVMKDLTVEAFSSGRTASERRATIEGVVDLVFRNAAEQPQLQHVFLAMSMRDSEIARIRAESERRGRTAIAALIAEVAPSGRIADPIAAAEVIQIAANEVAIATIGTRGDTKTPAEAFALRGALAEMIYRYVFGDD